VPPSVEFPNSMGNNPIQPAQSVAALVGVLFFCGGILVLALSPDKWQTFKKMVHAFLAIILLLVIVGFTVALPLPPIRVVVADLTGTLVLSMGLLWATLMGWHHVRSLNNPKH
jgi:uncharacterized membrane protein